MNRTADRYRAPAVRGRVGLWVFCSNCGNKLDHPVRFCATCGNVAPFQQDRFAEPIQQQSLLKPIVKVCSFLTLACFVGVIALRVKGNKPSGSPQIGDTVAVSSGVWPCGSTQDATDEAMRWLIRGETTEAAVVIQRTGSSLVQPGDFLKILDMGSVRSRVRILESGRVCWIPSQVAQAGRLPEPFRATESATSRRAGKPGGVRIGESLTIGPGGSWPCSPEESDVLLLKHWRDQMMDDRAPNSVMNGLAHALLKTRSAMVGTKDTITVLAVGRGAYRVKVMPFKSSVGRGGSMRDALQGCWISAEALNQ